MSKPQSAQNIVSKSWSEHFIQTAKLAGPVMVARAGILVLIAVDTAMTGHASTAELAAYAVASAPLVPMLLLGVGLLSGTTVFIAHAVASGSPEEAGRIWRVSQAFALVFGLLMFAVCLAGESLLLLLGQTDDLARQGGRVLAWMGLGLPGALMFATSSFAIESLGRPSMGVVIMALANLLNIGLNWLLIYGNAGFPQMGAEGAALATSLARWFSAVALIAYVYRCVDRTKFGISGKIPNPMATFGRLFRFGLPMGIAHTLESSAFATMVIFAGWMGTTVIAAYQAAFNLIAIPFMVALGFTTAASVYVAAALGAASSRDAVRATVSASVLCILALSIVSIALMATPATFASIYTDDSELLALCIPAVVMAGLVVVPDGLQATLMGALRGFRDVWPATGLYLLSFWGVMVPAGYMFGVTGHGGPTELLVATLLGVTFACGLFALRFCAVSRTWTPAIP